MKKVKTLVDTYMACVDGLNAMVFLEKGSKVRLIKLYNKEVAKVTVKVGKYWVTGYISCERLDLPEEE